MCVCQRQINSKNSCRRPISDSRRTCDCDDSDLTDQNLRLQPARRLGLIKVSVSRVTISPLRAQDSTRVCPLFPLKENPEDLQKVVQERLSDLLRVLKAVIGKHQTLNSVDILGAAGMVIAKVKGQWLDTNKVGLTIFVL